MPKFIGILFLSTCRQMRKLCFPICEVRYGHLIFSEQLYEWNLFDISVWNHLIVFVPLLSYILTPCVDEDIYSKQSHV